MPVRDRPLAGHLQMDSLPKDPTKRSCGFWARWSVIIPLAHYLHWHLPMIFSLNTPSSRSPVLWPSLKYLACLRNVYRRDVNDVSPHMPPLQDRPLKMFVKDFCLVIDEGWPAYATNVQVIQYEHTWTCCTPNHFSVTSTLRRCIVTYCAFTPSLCL
jgi:hypothetical protein